MTRRLALGRVVSWKDWGFEYQAGPRHRHIIPGTLGFDVGSKGLTVTGRAAEQTDEEELEGPEVTEFKATAARLNFMAQVCPDVQFATKEVCRETSSPTRGSWARAKRMARCLLSRERAVHRYE